MNENSDLVNAKEKLSSIIKKYGSLELLRKEYNLYQKSSNEGNKEAAADSRKVDRLKKKIQSIEERNGVLKDKEESRYKEHCMKVKAIIEKHQSLNDLKDTFNIYRKSKKRKHKEANNDMKNYERNIKKIKVMKRKRK